MRSRELARWIIVLAASGVILTSPYGGKVAIGALKEYLAKKTKAKEREQLLDSQNISRTLYRLKKRKLIRIRRVGNKTILELTEQGRKKKLAYDFEKISVPKPKIWDRNWRMLMFDIPEAEKFTRDDLRRKLKNMGFHQFQRSVWIYPYSCEDEIDFISEYLRIAKFITLLTVKIENDRPLRETFKLR